MTDVTQIFGQIESGDPSAAQQLLPLMYDEHRKLAVTLQQVFSSDDDGPDSKRTSN